MGLSVLPSSCACVLALAGCALDRSGAALGAEGQGAGSAADGAGAGSSTTGSSGGGSGGEDCLNGADDDGNGQVDCADPACTRDYECVELAPSGWDGYFQLSTKPFSDQTPPPSCADGSPAERRYRGPLDAPASCEACACGTVTGVACNPPKLECWSDDSCGSSGGTATDWSNEIGSVACYPHTPLNQTSSCRVTAAASVADQGGCPPSGGGATVSDPWEHHDDVCGTPPGGGGCGAGVCLPRATTCIRHDGESACPAGFEGGVFTSYASYEDDRACSDCVCAASGSSCSGGSYTIYACRLDCTDAMGNGCVDPSTKTFSAGGSCQNMSSYIGAPPWSGSAVAPSVSLGSCSPSGGEPIGSVARTGIATYCCVR